MKTFAQHEADMALLNSNPEKFLEMAEERIRQNPNDASAYLDRFNARFKHGPLDLALADLDRSIALGQTHPLTTLTRGETLYRLGRIDDALAEFRKGKALDPVLWRDFGGPVYEADCLARQGDEAGAIAMCSKIRDDGYLSFGLFGLPHGTKQEITEEIRRRAAEKGLR
ncbi:MAG TPA: hypothetical protein VGG27_10435 [Magnetospirillaceae bacterium]|jgi:tetratricopeptide (TPR) repeat protein